MNEEKELQCQKIEENVKHLEKKLYETEDMIRKCYKEVDSLTHKLYEEENEIKQRELLKLKASIPDFDEETYQKYKTYFKMEYDIKHKCSETEIKIFDLKSKITCLESERHLFMSHINDLQQQLDKFNSVEKVVN